MYENNVSFKQERKQAIDIALDLGYDAQCIKELEKAKNSIELTNILISARRRQEK